VAKLNDEHKRWIVTQWAFYRNQREIMDGFNGEFGFAITVAQAQFYNLSEGLVKRTAASPHLQLLFDEARKKYLTEITSIPVANAAFRLHRLQEMFEVHHANRNWKSAASILEQAAKESGGAFTNRHEVDAKSKVDMTMTDEADIPAEVKRDMLKARMREIIAAAAPLPEAPPPKTKH
jgi:hypothetical protein